MSNNSNPNKELQGKSPARPAVGYTGLFANVFNVEMPKNHLKYGHFFLKLKLNGAEVVE